MYLYDRQCALKGSFGGRVLAHARTINNTGHFFLVVLLEFGDEALCRGCASTCAAWKLSVVGLNLMI